VDRVKKATAKEIAAIPGISEKSAAAMLEWLIQ
jgi:DNA uptake protein ComE-like DNA-binding protein